MKKPSLLLLLPLCALLLFVSGCGSSASSSQAKSHQASKPLLALQKVHSSDCFSREGTLIENGGTGVTQGITFNSCSGIFMSTERAFTFDKVLLRYSYPGVAEQQIEDRSNPVVNPVQFRTIYTIKVKGCSQEIIGWSCTDNWDVYQVATYYPGDCLQGYVWRGAFDSDHVCVPPTTRDETAYDNSQAWNRIDPNGAYGPDTCLQGFVWRGVVESDHVCVTPFTRAQVQDDNAHAYERSYH